MEGSLLMKYFYAIIKKNYKMRASERKRRATRTMLCWKRKKRWRKQKHSWGSWSFNHFSSSSSMLLFAMHTIKTSHPYSHCHHQQNKSFYTSSAKVFHFNFFSPSHPFAPMCAGKKHNQLYEIAKVFEANKQKSEWASEQARENELLLLRPTGCVWIPSQFLVP